MLNTENRHWYGFSEVRYWGCELVFADYIHSMTGQDAGYRSQEWPWLAEAECAGNKSACFGYCLWLGPFLWLGWPMFIESCWLVRSLTSHSLENSSFDLFSYPQFKPCCHLWHALDKIETYKCHGRWKMRLNPPAGRKRFSDSHRSKCINSAAPLAFGRYDIVDVDRCIVYKWYLFFGCRYRIEINTWKT